MQKFTIVKGFNAHDHFREPEDFRFPLAVLCASRWFSRSTVMPNFTARAPVTTGTMAKEYRTQILRQAEEFGQPNFQPVMTIYITPETTKEVIFEACLMGVRAAKLYPKHGTTGSGHGIYDYQAPLLHEVFKAMTECGMLLLIHAELQDPRLDPQEREAAFMPILKMIHECHPTLKIVVEHLTSENGVHTVMDMPANIAATVTVHHLYLTWEQARRNPHNLCMPVAKRPEDRDALLEFVLSGNPKAMLGTDGAPHPRNKKEGVEDPAFGVATMDGTIPLLLKKMGPDHPHLENFICRNAERFYDLEPTTQTITLVERPWTMPESYDDKHPSGGVVPFMAGQTMSYMLESDHLKLETFVQHTRLMMGED